MTLIDLLHGLFTVLFDYFSGVLDGILGNALNGLFGIETPPETN